MAKDHGMIEPFEPGQVRMHDGQTFRKVVGGAICMDVDQYREFCSNPPEWFRGE